MGRLCFPKNTDACKLSSCVIQKEQIILIYCLLKYKQNRYVRSVKPVLIKSERNNCECIALRHYIRVGI